MTEPGRSSFLNRTLHNLRSGWQAIAGSTYDAAAASMRPDLPGDDAERLERQMRACLASRGGEVSARAEAAALGHIYLALNEVGRERYLRLLGERFDVDHEAVASAVAAFGEAADVEGRRAAEGALRRALEAPRVRLLTRFNALPQGVKFLVDMRAELRKLGGEDPGLHGLDLDLRGLLETWFDVDFLELRRITWDTASAALLEKLIAYEAVHAIESWEDLKDRLDSDRRCFAYFHPRMPDEPLIFVEVALVDGMADNIQALLDEEAPVGDPGDADTAIFYSISNAQRGLAGISIGNFLIKRVVDNLASEFKGLKTFATLSPIPGFRAWLDRSLARGEPHLLLPAERKALNDAGERARGAKGILKAILDRADWHEDAGLAAAVRPALMRLCARYLLEQKDERGLPLDRVAHFHLSNGARLERLDWLADRSVAGFKRSAGIMANYAYGMADIEANHETYVATGRVTASGAVRGLIK